MPEAVTDRLNGPTRTFAERFHNRVTAWVVLIISLAITWASWYISNTSVAQRAEERFEHEVDSAAVAIGKRMQEYEQVLRGGIALFRASDTVTRADWNEYVSTLNIDTYWPGIQGIGYAMMIPAADLAGHLRAMRSSGFPDYALSPPGERPIYSSIVYIEPFTGRNLRAFGYDMFAEPTRRRAMEQARDSGKPALSGRVTLVQETGPDIQAGFLMYMPLYRGGKVPETLDQRRNALSGFVYSPFRTHDLMQGILGGDSLDLDFAIYDQGGSAPETLLYDSRSHRGNTAVPAASPQFATTRSIVLPGRTWTVLFRSRPAFEGEMSSSQPLFIAVGGVVVDALLFAIFLSLSRQQQRTAASAREAARLLDEVSEAHRFANQIIETATVMVVGLDQNGRILLFNDKAEQVTGYRRQDAMGQDWLALMVPAAHRSAMSEEFHRLRSRSAAPDELVCPIATAAGEERMIAWRNSVVVEKAEVLATLSFGIDITEERRLTAELARHQAHLEDLVIERTAQLEAARLAAESASRAKSAFLANMSHEIRTPLNAILGLTYLVQQDVQDTTQAERLKKVAEAANSLLGTLSTVLDIARIEADKFALDNALFHLDSLLLNTLSMVGDQAEEKGLDVRLDLDPALPLSYRGDAVRLQQILVNFASNAVKFSTAGVIVIHCRAEDATPSHLRVRFAIEDQGMGIPPETLSRLFQPFAQGDSSATRKHGGAGLGLAISKRLVQLMGGDVGVESEVGRGSTFWFTVPLERVEAAAAERVEAAAAAAAEPVPAPAPAPAPEPRRPQWTLPPEESLRQRHRGCRVLVAEDNPVIRELAQELLSDAGLTVELVADGDAAVERAARRRYDLIILDTRMPGLGGREAAQRIQAGSNGDTPILVMDSQGSPADAGSGPFAGQIAKPIDPDQFYAALLNALEPGAPSSAAAG